MTTIRPLEDSDIPAVLAIYARNRAEVQAQGVELNDLPDLRDGSRCFAYVAVEDGRVAAALIFKTVVECISVADSPRALNQAILQHEGMREVFKQSRVSRLYTFFPKARRSLAKLLRRTGWEPVPDSCVAFFTEV